MNKNSETEFIPFHRPYFDEDEISEVTDTIKSGWWTMGPKTQKFEEEFRKYIGSEYAVSTSSWTTGAHLVLEALGLKPGDEVIVPAITFTASAEVVCYFNAKPVIVDVDIDTLNISPEEIKKHITSKTRAIIAVHYAGLPCEMDLIRAIAKNHNLFILEDAAHALPAWLNGEKIGKLGDAVCFSFYATKTLSAGEGGMICTNNEKIAQRCKLMRLHGINKDAWKRYDNDGDWFYEVTAPGYKYNLTDIQSALALAQLKKLEMMWTKRKIIAERYNEGVKDNCFVKTPAIVKNRESAYHLYTIQIELERLKINRAQFINELKNRGIGTSVHFIPLYRHSFYREKFSLSPDNFPVSENIFNRIISLPIWPGMNDTQIERVINNVNEVSKIFKK